MKTYPTPNRRAFAALIPATLLLAAPAFAQETQTTSPPTVTTAPPPAAVAPVQTVTPPRVVPTLPTAPATPVTETATPAPEAEAAPAPAARRVVRRAPSPVARSRPAAPAPVAAAPAVTPAPVVEPAPVATTEPAPQPVTPPASTNPAPQIDTPVETSTTTTAAPIWPWIVGGLVVIAGIAALLLGRRRRVVEEPYEEAAYAEPSATAVAASRVAPAPIVAEREPQFLRPAAVAPVAAAPIEAAPFVPTEAQAEQTASEDASLAKPDAEDVAALTTADAPVSNRPWLEFAMRPVRAGTNVDEALVEIELTIGNSGTVTAQDVRVSTFMFAAEPGTSANIEQMLLDREDNGVPPITIEPGEGTRVDATLAVPRAELTARASDSFSPVVVADARYTLPDGSEGRTSASFRIGLSEDGGVAMSPFSIDEKAMREDIEAELYGTPQRA